MPTRKTGVVMHVDMLEGTLKDTEQVLFDGVIDKALQHLLRSMPREYGFACRELLDKRTRLRAAATRRVSHVVAQSKS